MIANFFIMLFNNIIALLGKIGNIAMALLPNSPMTAINNFMLDSEILGSLNWVIPIDTAITILTLWIPALFVIYLVQVILKWVKAL